MTGPLLAIVPAYNEARSVGAVVADLLATSVKGHRVDVLVVDDGSVDNTAGVAREAGASVLSLPTNLGIGGALRAGFLLARARGYAVAFQFDADGQHLARWVPALVEPVLSGRADLALGSRFGVAVPGAPSEGPRYRASPGRRVGMRLVARAVRHLVGTNFTDPTSGFRAFSPKAIGAFADGYPTDYMDSAESLVLAHRVGLEVEEVAVEMAARAHGRSSAGTLIAGWNTGRALFSVYALHWRLRRAGAR